MDQKPDITVVLNLDNIDQANLVAMFEEACRAKMPIGLVYKGRTDALRVEEVERNAVLDGSRRFHCSVMKSL